MTKQLLFVLFSLGFVQAQAVCESEMKQWSVQAANETCQAFGSVDAESVTIVPGSFQVSDSTATLKGEQGYEVSFFHMSCKQGTDFMKLDIMGVFSFKEDPSANPVLQKGFKRVGQCVIGVAIGGTTEKTL